MAVSRFRAGVSLTSTPSMKIEPSRQHEQRWARTDDDEGKVTLLRTYDPHATNMDVPDPYYAAPEMFDAVLGMIETATHGLFSQLEPAVRTPHPTHRA